MSTFDYHVLHEVGAGRHAVTRTIARASNWSRPFIEHVDSTRAHAYLDRYLGAPRALRYAGLLPVGIQAHTLNNAKIRHSMA